MMVGKQWMITKHLTNATPKIPRTAQTKPISHKNSLTVKLKPVVPMVTGGWAR